MSNTFTLALAVLLGFQNGWWASNRFRLLVDRARRLSIRAGRDEG